MIEEKNPALRAAHTLQKSLPEGGLFHEKEWRITPEPFGISPTLADELDKLGYRLTKFVHACNNLYHASIKGSAPPWIAQWLDAGKPETLINIGREKILRNEIPRVLRPDLILTEDGFTIAELDNVPGGIGLTAWLNQQYTQLGFDILGGPEGMLQGFHKITQEADILVSKEAETYRPEMQWLAATLNKTISTNYRVLNAEDPADWKDRIYRFFELFDLPNIPTIQSIAKSILNGERQITPPLKPALEEKMWFALFWMQPLEDFWSRELGQRQFDALKKVIPFTLILNPSPLPPQAVYPRLEIQSWDTLKKASKKDRNYVLKVSGFSEIGWGSRSVTIGSDASQKEWSDAIDQALAAHPTQPYILQEFRPGSIFEQPVFNPEKNSIEAMPGRVRLCPYYFLDSANEKNTSLGGALATICPPDKKLLHGMRDAILAPTYVLKIDE
ncbi:MAG: hypothetical protein ACK5NG_06930 [Chthoniobacterales bacterium]